MRSIDVDRLTVGPETDDLFARHVMDGDYDSRFLCPRCGSTHFGSSEKNGRYTRQCHDGCGATFDDDKECFPIPEFSVDISAVGLGLEKFKHMGISITFNPQQKIWSCNVWKKNVMGVDTEIEMAICKALLKAAAE